MKTIIKEYRGPVNLTADNIVILNGKLTKALKSDDPVKAEIYAGIIKTMSEALYFMGEGKK